VKLKWEFPLILKLVGWENIGVSAKTACWMPQRLNLFQVYGEITCNGKCLIYTRTYRRLWTIRHFLCKHILILHGARTHMSTMSVTSSVKPDILQKSNLVLMLHWISLSKARGELPCTLTGSRIWLVTRSTLNSLHPQRKIGLNQLEMMRVGPQAQSGMCREETTDFPFPIMES
jgi:hypothetical protein